MGLLLSYNPLCHSGNRIWKPEVSLSSWHVFLCATNHSRPKVSSILNPMWLLLFKKLYKYGEALIIFELNIFLSSQISKWATAIAYPEFYTHTHVTLRQCPSDFWLLFAFLYQNKVIMYLIFSAAFSLNYLIVHRTVSLRNYICTWCSLMFNFSAYRTSLHKNQWRVEGCYI